MVGDSMISGIVWYVDMCKWHAYQPVKVVGAWLTWLTWLLLILAYKLCICIHKWRERGWCKIL